MTHIKFIRNPTILTEPMDIKAGFIGSIPLQDSSNNRGAMLAQNHAKLDFQSGLTESVVYKKVSDSA